MSRRTGRRGRVNDLTSAVDHICHGMLCSVLRPRGDVCKWVRLILHVGPFACQNLSLIVRGQRLHKADGVPKDVFRRLCETEKRPKTPKRCDMLLQSNPLQIAQGIHSTLELGPAERCQKNFAMISSSNKHAHICTSMFVRTCIPQP